MLAFVPQKPGEGVTLHRPKAMKKIERRIEELGKMNDRRLRYLGDRNCEGLLQLAAEYAARNMPRMAAEIQKEAVSL